MNALGRRLEARVGIDPIDSAGVRARSAGDSDPVSRAVG